MDDIFKTVLAFIALIIAINVVAALFLWSLSLTS